MNIRTAAGIVGILGLAATAPLIAQAPAKHPVVTPGDLKWGAAPPSLPPGAQAAVLEGDPSKAALFTIRLKFPDGFKVPPHSHPTDEHVTVLAGTLMAGMGDKIDEPAMHTMTVGSYAKMAAG